MIAEDESSPVTNCPSQQKELLKTKLELDFTATAGENVNASGAKENTPLNKRKHNNPERCYSCSGCYRLVNRIDCHNCVACKDLKKNGGPGVLRRLCPFKFCQNAKKKKTYTQKKGKPFNGKSLVMSKAKTVENVNNVDDKITAQKPVQVPYTTVKWKIGEEVVSTARIKQTEKARPRAIPGREISSSVDEEIPCKNLEEGGNMTVKKKRCRMCPGCTRFSKKIDCNNCINCKRKITEKKAGINSTSFCKHRVCHKPHLVVKRVEGKKKIPAVKKTKGRTKKPKGAAERLEGSARGMNKSEPTEVSSDVPHFSIVAEPRMQHYDNAAEQEVTDSRSDEDNAASDNKTKKQQQAKSDRCYNCRGCFNFIKEIDCGKCNSCLDRKKFDRRGRAICRARVCSNSTVNLTAHLASLTSEEMEKKSSFKEKQLEVSTAVPVSEISSTIQESSEPSKPVWNCRFCDQEYIYQSHALILKHQKVCTKRMLYFKKLERKEVSLDVPKMQSRIGSIINDSACNSSIGNLSTSSSNRRDLPLDITAGNGVEVPVRPEHSPVQSGGGSSDQFSGEALHARSDALEPSEEDGSVMQRVNSAELHHESIVEPYNEPWLSPGESIECHDEPIKSERGDDTSEMMSPQSGLITCSHCGNALPAEEIWSEDFDVHQCSFCKEILKKLVHLGRYSQQNSLSNVDKRLVGMKPTRVPHAIEYVYMPIARERISQAIKYIYLPKAKEEINLTSMCKTFWCSDVIQKSNRLFHGDLYMSQVQQQLLRAEMPFNKNLNLIPYNSQEDPCAHTKEEREFDSCERKVICEWLSL